MTKKEEALKRIADRKAALAKLKESAQKAAEPNELVNPDHPNELVNPDHPNEPEPNEPESESPEVSEVEKEPIIGLM